MADEHVGRDEFRTWREDLKERLDGMDKRIDEKVPLGAWNLQNNHFATTLAEQDNDCRERHEDAKKSVAAVNQRIDKRGDKTWTRVLGVVSIAVALLVGLLGIYISSKGIK